MYVSKKNLTNSYYMQVNNNGDITFDAPLSQYTSQAFPISGSHKIIAPFWTDIDTRYGGYLLHKVPFYSEEPTKSALYFLTLSIFLLLG